MTSDIIRQRRVGISMSRRADAVPARRGMEIGAERNQRGLSWRQKVARECDRERSRERPPRVYVVVCKRVRYFRVRVTARHFGRRRNSTSGA